MSKRFVVPALLLAATTAATAQPAATPAAAPAAPQTHDWGQVNHINGQVVKVGETNEYEKTFRKTIVSANPLGWIAGFYGASVSHAVSDHVAIRGDANYVDLVDNESTKYWELGVGVPLYLKRTYSGPFLEPGFVVRGSEQEQYYSSSGSSSSDETDIVAGPQMLFGWHLTWDSGFSVAAAAGLGRNIASNESTNEYDYDSDEEIFFNGYFRVGYAF